MAGGCMPPTRIPMPSVGRRGCSWVAAQSRLPPSKAGAFATARAGPASPSRSRSHARTQERALLAARGCYIVGYFNEFTQTAPMRAGYNILGSPANRALCSLRLRSAAVRNCSHRFRSRPSPGPRIQAASAHECNCNRRRIRLSSSARSARAAQRKRAQCRDQHTARPEGPISRA